jgi:hypothetical protein
MEPFEPTSADQLAAERILEAALDPSLDSGAGRPDGAMSSEKPSWPSDRLDRCAAAAFELGVATHRHARRHRPAAAANPGRQALRSSPQQ